MFEHGKPSRVFGIAPGVDFPAALISGLRSRIEGQPPHKMAQIDLIVNTRRMARRLRSLFDTGPAGFLPRIRLLTDLDTLVPSIALPPATASLRRRLELVQLVSSLLDTDKSIAPRASLYALSDSLATLIDEMQGEGVTAEDIAHLDVSDQSGHWERAKQFLAIADRYLDGMNSAPDVEARQRKLVKAISEHWQNSPPENPVIVAGSTGSRGTTSMLMEAVAKLPQGALVLPGFDFAMPVEMWGSLTGDTPPEDHPQFRFFDLLQQLGLSRKDVGEWADVPAPSPERNALISLSLRPAPITDTWMSEGPKLTHLEKATKDLTLIEAPTPRIEALAIALRLRKAVEEGKTAALITPDRMLTRQVTSALDRWNILPDDSAGTPLQLSPPGRFLRHIAGLYGRKLDTEALLTLLKHPLTHSGAGRNEHQLNTARLEMQIRRDGLPYPDPDGLTRIGNKVALSLEAPDKFLAWVSWVTEVFCGHYPQSNHPLENWVDLHQALAEKVATGSTNDDQHELWKKKAGQKARGVMQGLAEHAEFGGVMNASDYADLMAALLSGEEVRDRDAPHPLVMIWGTLEARVHGADLVIMAGLNDGTWPEAPAPDPWLNRQMRLRVGLLLPERRIGLSAHDYQQAIAAPEVCLTRAIRSDEAETIPSRWLNRLENLLLGLPDQKGASAWEGMRARGAEWIAQSHALEAFERTEPAIRPSPRPPVTARPRSLSVTEIQRLIRDPYAIYAKHTLRLRPVNPLVQSPDARERGVVMHTIMERFIRSVLDDPQHLSKANLLQVADRVLHEQAPWPVARLIWLTRIERVADWFIAQEIKRQSYATPKLLEKTAMGKHVFEDLGFTLSGTADRVDQTDAGTAILYDYKTGTPPSADKQKHFDKQLLLEAAMIEEGGFKNIGPTSVDQAIFIGLGPKPEEKSAPLDTEPPKVVLAGLRSLIASYLTKDQGFTARRMMEKDGFAGDYDQLARYGEWDGTTPVTPEDLV
ncbi:MAG: double-strand break repair protein AddB [Sulfitobacter sp.]